MKTFKELMAAAVDDLTSSGVAEAELGAWYLLVWSVALFHVEGEDDGNEAANACDIAKIMPNRAWYLTHGDDLADESVSEIFERLIGYRKKGCPLEYITHYTEFMGLPIYVDPSVLIPRQDTECLVEKAIAVTEKYFSEKKPDVLDMCTGSGCIAISIAKLCDINSMTASDKSAEALGVAAKNAGINDADIKFLQGDMWEKVEDTFDIIVSNPPYITRDVIPTLMREVREYEPVMALDGGDDGLDFYRKIVSGIERFLRKNGWLILEIGYDQADAVRALLSESGMIDIEVIKDLAGLDRVVCGRKR